MVGLSTVFYLKNIKFYWADAGPDPDWDPTTNTWKGYERVKDSMKSQSPSSS